jgi:murein DD-endopeptidase MepM/ murein hydrolase activator NlpD
MGGRTHPCWARGHGRFAFYGHLRPGSIRVRPGDRVRRGQVIGAVGFSGSAGGPQLHFHVGDAASSLGGEGLPFELEAFQLLGNLAPEAQRDPCDGAARVLESLGESPWIASSGSLAPHRIRELPAPNAVIQFGTDH